MMDPIEARQVAEPEPQFRIHRMHRKPEYEFIDIGSDYRLHMWTEDEPDTLSRLTGRTEVLCLELELRWGDLHFQRKISAIEMAQAMKRGQFHLQKLIDAHVKHMRHELLRAQDEGVDLLQRMWQKAPISGLLTRIKGYV